MRRRVVVTGIGVVSPLGTGKTSFAENLLVGTGGIRPIERFDTSRFPAKLGGEVAGFNPRDFIGPASIRRMDRLSQMLTAAARMAVEDAGLNLETVGRDNVGLIFGTSFGGTDIATQYSKVLFTESPRRANPILVPNTVMNAPAGHAAIELGVRGVNSTVNHREASAETALAYAAAEIMRGRSEVVLAGGGDVLTEFCFNVLSHFKTLSPQNGGPEGLRPFDKSRNGMVVGEGAGVLCLESLESAEARGAIPYCEVVGWGMAAAPAGPNDYPKSPEGPCLAINRAMQAAGVVAGDIDLVSASANGGLRLDRLEADVLQQVFAAQGARPQIYAQKGAMGESFSSGGMRMAAMAVFLREQRYGVTVGLSEPILDLPFASLSAQAGSILNFGLVNGFSSGGTFVSVIFKKYDDKR